MKRLLLRLAAGCLGLSSIAPAVANDEASIARGGRLYDNWILELKALPPGRPHPLFSARRNVAVIDTWRCSECHGIDYTGRHGIPGIQKRQGSDLAALVALLKDGTHRYGGVLSEADLLDLARFVARGQLDIPAVIQTARRAQTDPAETARYYGTICAACHGQDGGKLREIQMLGDVARQNPGVVVHSILNGHPGQAMPALRELGTGFTTHMLRYLQTLPSVNLAASIARGGRLYDNWMTETGMQKPPLPHPAYPATAFYANDAGLTWRCKSCHGWDYLGKQGSYGGGRAATGIKGIRGQAGADPAQIAAILRDANHRFDAVLKVRDLDDLVNFVGRGQIDMDAAIERANQRARGDAKRAGPFYNTFCANCHGSDGRHIITTVPLGRLARENPWESLHKILNGHPNEKMPALRELDHQLLIDILAYLQGLP